MKKTIAFILLLVSFSGLSVFSDTREENIDLFLVLDKSLSMVQEIEAVKDYVGDFLIDTFLIPGDNVVIINFYGKAETVIETGYNDDSRTMVLNTIDKIIADGRFTDIGNALDLLNHELEFFPETGRTGYLLLITDGIQEAPPDSIYWSEDGTFNHHFLENTKTIRKKGWKIQIIGIGSETAAKLIAEELSAAYSEVGGNGELVPEDLVEASKNITGSIIPVSDPVFTGINDDGRSELKISVKSTGYEEAVAIRIKGVFFTGDFLEKWDLISETNRTEEAVKFMDFTLAPGETADFRVPVKFPVEEPGFVYDGAVFFTFDGDYSIEPAYFEVKASVKKPFPLWILYLLAGIAAASAVFYAVKKGIDKNKSESKTDDVLDLKCTINGKREIVKNIVLGNEDKIFIITRGFGIDFMKSRSSDIEKALGYVFKQGNELRIKNLEPEKFRTKKLLTGNIIEKELDFIISGKDKILLSFKKNVK